VITAPLPVPVRLVLLDINLIVTQADAWRFNALPVVCFALLILLVYPAGVDIC